MDIPTPTTSNPKSELPEVAPKPKPRQTYLKIFLLILAGLALVFIILAVSGLRITRKESLLDIWFASRKSAPTAEPSPALEAAANWKTYADEKYKYQFKYPPEWPIETHDVPNFPSNRVTSLGKNSALIINVDKVSQIDDRNCQSKKAIYNNQGYEAESISVAGNSAWRVALPGGQNPKSDVICLENDGLIYEILYSYNTLSSESEQKKIYTQILSTFEFLDQTSSTESWKTYTSKQYGFSLKYPNLPEWNYDDSGTKGEGIVVFYNYDINKAPGRSFSQKDGNLLKVRVYADDKFSAVSQWLSNKRKEIDPVTNQPIEVLNLKEILVDSQKGYFFEVKDSFGGALLGVAAFESPEKKVFALDSGLNYEANKDTFNQILSTFKFSK